MALCISNIAWPPEQEEAFLPLLPEHGCQLLEVAPSKVWPEPVAVSPAQRRSYKQLVDSFGLRIVSMQALLYSRPDLRLFDSEEGDREVSHYLMALCEVAADLEAEVMVLGSPKNRRRGSLSKEAAMKRSAGVLAQVAQRAKELGTMLCIEPLGVSENDFITTAEEGMELVRMVDHPGFGLHLDAKALSEETADLDETMRLAVPFLRHFHISEPNLAIPGTSGLVDHARMGRILAESGYALATGIEMARQPDCRQAVLEALTRAAGWYLA